MIRQSAAGLIDRIDPGIDESACTRAFTHAIAPAPSRSKDKYAAERPSSAIQAANMYADVWIGSSVMTQQDSHPTGHRLGNSTSRNVAIREDQGTADAISVEQFQAYDHLVATLYGCLHSNRGFDSFFLAFQAQFRNLQCAILGLSKHPTRMLYGWTHGYPPGFEQMFINSDLPEQDAALRHFSNLPPRQFDSLVGCDPNVYIGDLLTDATRACKVHSGVSTRSSTTPSLPRSLTPVAAFAKALCCCTNMRVTA